MGECWATTFQRARDSLRNTVGMTVSATIT
jgi:hypothetical protein